MSKKQIDDMQKRELTEIISTGQNTRICYMVYFRLKILTLQTEKLFYAQYSIDYIFIKKNYHI